jgi:hypothetical protein
MGLGRPPTQGKPGQGKGQGQKYDLAPKPRVLQKIVEGTSSLAFGLVGDDHRVANLHEPLSDRTR